MWDNKSKNSGNTPTFKGKIATRIERGYILTPDSLGILVGASEDLILIYQDNGTLWTHKTKVPLS